MNNNKTNVFCLSYAGGSSSVYRSWQKICPDNIEIIPIELAGKGRRFKEVGYDSLEECVEDIYKRIEPKICKSKFALFGHSMGSLLVYEVAHFLMNRIKKEPEYLFCSARFAPHIIKPIDYHLLSDEQLVNLINKSGGERLKEVNDWDGFVKLYLPILRNDFKMMANYEYKEKVKLNCPIIVLNGIDDNIQIEELTQWEQHTNSYSEVVNFEGDHFFIDKKSKEIVDLINQKVNNK